MRISTDTLVDANLLLRRVQPTHPHFVATNHAIRTITRRGERIYVCPQNATEFWAVSTRPVAVNGLGMSPAQAEAELARIEAFFPMLEDRPEIYPHWRRLVIGAGVSGKTTHDARLLAVALAHGVTRLLTFNVTDFTRFAALAPTVQIVDPNTV